MRVESAKNGHGTDDHDPSSKIHVRPPAGAPVLLGTAGGEGAVREQRGREVPDPPAALPIAATRLGRSLLFLLVPRGEEGTPHLLGAKETGGPRQGIRQAGPRTHPLLPGCSTDLIRVHAVNQIPQGWRESPQ